MNVAILIFLIINALIIGLIAFACVCDMIESRTKLYKKCGVLENENKVLASLGNSYLKRLEEYKKKMPLKAKYGPGEKVVCVIKDKVIKGIVRAVNLYENEQVDYQIEIINNKDKTISNTMSIPENNVYPENTVKV